MPTKCVVRDKRTRIELLLLAIIAKNFKTKNQRFFPAGSPEPIPITNSGKVKLTIILPMGTRNDFFRRLKKFMKKSEVKLIHQTA